MNGLKESYRQHMNFCAILNLPLLPVCKTLMASLEECSNGARMAKEVANDGLGMVVSSISPALGRLRQGGS